MPQKARQTATLLVCAAFLYGLPLAHFLTPDKALSRWERRPLAQAPVFSLQAFHQGEYTGDLETYLLDQFPARDSFRTVKAVVSRHLLRKSDNNDVLQLDGHLTKLDYPLERPQLNAAIRRFLAVSEQYLGDARQVAWAAIPDKNYFLAQSHTLPVLDYEAMLTALREGLPGMTEIPLFDLLSLDDYYTTDSHWRQERIRPVAERILSALSMPAPSWEGWEEERQNGFEGVFLGQSALPLPGEELVWLTSPVTEGATVAGPDGPTATVYAPERLTGMDGYDVFLSGAQSLLTVENPAGDPDRHLVLFRDSYGSSLAPLLMQDYGRVTLIDLRYLSSALLGEMVDFAGADVVFLYSTSVLNAGMLLK